MLRAYNAFLFAALMALPLGAREKTDVIYMKNGDHISCEIMGLDSGVLYISVDYLLGTQSLEWSKIQRLESKQLFIVKTDDGRSYVGTLSTAETGGSRAIRIAIAEPGQNVVLSGPELVQITQTSENFWERFNGSINTGSIYSKGNQASQYSLGSEVTYPRERWAASATASSTLSSSTGSSTSTHNDFGVEVRRLLAWNNWFYSAAGDFLQSSEQRIQLQTTLDGGIGRYLSNTHATQISVLAGMAWQSINYDQSRGSVPRQNVGAAEVGAKLRFFRFDKTEFDISTGVFPALNQAGRIHVNTNATYYVKVFSNLKWNVSFYGNWDNQPPPGFSGSDYGTSSGLGWTFGNR
jgi:Protein of unknown function, DUF481